MDELVINDLTKPVASGLQMGYRDAPIATFIAAPRPVFVSLETAARIIAVTPEIMREWVDSRSVPFFTIPPQDEPVFRPKEIRNWAWNRSRYHKSMLAPIKVQVVESAEYALPSTLEVPESIRSIDGLRTIATPKACSGVYFLCHHTEVVYIGQSWNVPARISNHLAEGAKEFDRAYFFLCAKSRLKQCERQLINRLLPKYNNDAETRILRSEREYQAKKAAQKAKANSIAAPSPSPEGTR